MTDGNYRSKARAVFLAALMVLSVFAGTVAFAGSASAAATDLTVSPGSVDLSAEDTSVDVTVTTEGATEEVSWALADSSGTVVANSGGTSAAANSEVTFNPDLGDLSSGTYTLAVAGDGTAAPAVDDDIGDYGDQETTLSVYDSGADEYDDVDAFYSDTGALLEEGLLWGQEVAVGGYDAGESVVLSEWQSDEDGARTAEQLTADDSGVIVFDSSQLEDGDYFLEPPAEGYDSDNPPETFEVLPQNLDVEFDDEEVSTGGTTDITFDSNRGTYNVDVSADGLDLDDLETIFTNGDWTDGDITQDDDDDHITIDAVSDGDYEVGFSEIDPGEYNFEFNVSDTSASDTANINVTEEDVDASFAEGVSSDTAGDIAEFTIELSDTDHTYVQFGDSDVGFVDVLYLEDDNDDDEVTFEVNTRALGTTNPENVYDSEDDIVESQIYDGGAIGDGAAYYDEDTDTPIGNAETGDDAFNAYLEELDLIDDADTEDGTDQLTRPLQAADYELTAAADGEFIINSDGNTEADEELDSALFELTQPSLDGITIHKAPEDNADQDDELQDVLDAATAIDEGGEVALDDRVIIQAEASGLYGAMVEENEGDFSTLEDGTALANVAPVFANAGDDWDGEGINFVVEADDATGNQDATELDYTGAGESDAT
ncbi:DUF7827 domain-containing protein [Halobellus rufus]|uniref:DUF7827 domain-containing protein n=1 Tax=Halobellus rufus TaxID=1448860 RepID=UPI0018CD2A77|nr:surface glycoprotein [Halobellus rufus]